MDLPSLSPNAPSELLDRIQEVCPIPQAAQRVMSLTSSETADARAVSEAIATDPALAAQLLRLANSANYARQKTVSDLTHAVAMVGMGEIRNMAAAMALMAAFRSTHEAAIELHRVSVLAGAIAARVTVHISGRPAPATFLSGLLSEIGALACFAVDSTAYLSLWSDIYGSGPRWSIAARTAREDRELLAYGAHTRTLGGALLRRNTLPEDLIAWVEAPSTLPPEAPLAMRATSFGRQVAPLILWIVSGSDVQDAETVVAELARATSLAELGPRVLLDTSLVAASLAEASLKKNSA